MATRAPVIDVIIPAYNEEHSIALVVGELPAGLVREVIVCNNNSKDRTAEVARAAGATVVDELRPGYGSACLRGMAHIAARAPEDWPDIVVFVDGDHSDYPEQLPELIAPILEEGVDLVIGSRALGELEPGSMQPQQVFGNWLATSLIKLIYGNAFTDLGPFRAIRYPALRELGMNDPDFGWTVEMQVRAAKARLRCTEVPVRYRKRIGVSKISGTIRGTILAGHKILWTIFKLI
ncbi:glycosyltransferase family 2 protein [Neolewinella lacunae]|uniref:Glycosyltransferase family 2 protein n=1 Tax=Neolewinella lacunae TaxID=1517758 RepID=A0A923PP33_9BACT|nr:glycosyltransferase family 2 protein [Neolewinella lacunae]MBC6994803.1 glycosyltransferase family 2 protein [Neolewinella lacunae]MDN3634425.1 glycosyltransferase family 2 protein [Neolewinella lacunae]